MVAMKLNSRARRGLALVEAAIVLPLLFLIVLGSLQYGWCFLKVQQLEQAARQGARVGALQTGTNAKVNSSITSIMAAAGMSGSGYVVTFRNGTTGTAISDVGDPSQLPPHNLLELTVTIPDYSTIGILGAPFIPMPDSLTRRTSVFKEGPL